MGLVGVSHLLPVAALALGLGEVATAAPDPGPAVELHDRLPPIESIAQTPDGFLWLGTLRGLYRYDGRELREHELGIADPAVRRLLVDVHGRLWVALGRGYLDPPQMPGGDFIVALREGAGGLLRLDPHLRAAPTVVVAPDGAPASWVWSLAAWSDAVWLGTERGLARVGPDDRLTWPSWPSSPGLQIVSSLRLTPTALWAATGSSVARLGTDGALAFRDEPNVLALLAHADGTLVLGRDTGLQGLAVAAPPVRVRALAETGGAKPTLWIGAFDGLYRATALGFARVAAQMLPFGVRALWVDPQEQALWVARKGGGLAVLHPAPVRLLGRDQGLPEENAHAVLVARDQAIWVATSSRLSRWSATGVTQWPLEPLDEPSGWRSLAEDGDGSVWLGAGALARVRDGRLERLRVDGGRRVRLLASDAAGSIWVGWQAGGVSRFAPRGRDVPTPEPAVGAECQGVAAALTAARGAGVWMAIAERLVRIDGPDQPCTRLARAPDAAPLTDLYALDDDVLLATAAGARGLRAWVNGIERAIDGAPPGSLYALTVSEHRLWITSYRGIFGSTPGQDVRAAVITGTPLSFVGWSSQDGLASDDFGTGGRPRLAGARNGLLFAANTRGLVMVDPSAAASSDSRRAPVLDEVRLDGRALATQEPVIAVPPGTRDVELIYAVPQPARAVRTWHRLSGVDRGWVPGTGRARYPGLSAGRYAFQVALGSRPPEAGGPAVTTLAALDVRPHWYARPVAQVTAGFLVLAAALALHRRRVRGLEREAQLVAEERARIAREVHDHLAQTFLGIGLHLDALSQRLSQRDPDDKGAHVLAQARSLLGQGRRDVRRAVLALTGAPQSLAEALARQVGEARAAAPAASITLTVEPSAANVKDALVSQELPAIAREAITNALAHGRATHVDVSVSREGADVVLLVRDDGGGLPPGVSGDEGFGLSSMRQRAARCGGTVRLAARPSGGTDVMVQVPYPARAEGSHV